MGIYDKDIERLGNAKAMAKMIIKELNKKNYKSYTLLELQKLLKEYNKEFYYYVMHVDDQYISENFLKWLKKREEK